MSHLARQYKILFVAPSYVPFTGGAQAFQQAMASRLIADGHEVTILTTNACEPADFWRRPAGSSGAKQHESMAGVRVERLALGYPWPQPYMFGVCRRAGYLLNRSHLPIRIQRPPLIWLARRMPPLPGLEQALAEWVRWADLVQVTDSSWDGIFTAAAEAAQLSGRRLVAVPLMHLGNPAVKAHFQMPHQVETYRSASAVAALSEREARAYEHLGVAPERVHVVPMGVDHSVPDPAAGVQAAVEWRRDHGLTGPMVAFVGATTYDKGAHTLARAVASLNQAGRQVHLVCAGPGREAMAAFLAGQPPEMRSMLAHRVHLLGVVDERSKDSLLTACNVLALPSRVDSFGIVFLEAWLHGRPVIGADAGGIPDLVRHEENGLLVPFGEVPALAAAIARLIDDPQLAARLGARGLQQVLAGYTWDQTYARMRRIYWQAADAPVSPTGVDR